MKGINLKTFKLVFSNYYYIFLAIFISCLFFSIAIIIPSFGLIKFFWNQGSFNLVSIITLSFNFFLYNSTLIAKSTLFILVILSGLNFTLLIFYLKRRIKLEKSLGTGLVGSILGILGFGCATCGSLILTSIFGFSATVGFLSILPFKGLEFAFLGIILLLFSIYTLITKISNPLFCQYHKSIVK